MARFTIFTPSERALALNARMPSTYGAPFVGFDTCKAGTQATEASDLDGLDARLWNKDAERLAKLAPGERMCIDGLVYAYDG